MLTHKTSKEKAFEVSSSGKHNSSVSLLLLQSRGKKMHCLSRGGSGTRYMVFSYSKWNMFQQASSDLFASACLLTLLVSKEKREADSSQRLFILLSVSFFLKWLLKYLQKVVSLTCHRLSLCEKVAQRSGNSGGADQCIYIWFSKPGSLIVWLVFRNVKCIFSCQKHLHIKAEQHLWNFFNKEFVYRFIEEIQ